MILLISVFLTDQRPNNRYDRYEIFKYTLFSYRNINFSNIYILVELDEIYKNKKDELSNFIYNNFNIPNNNIYINYDKRFDNQNEWKTFMNTHIYNKFDINELILFCQCDDHIFIDFNMDVLNEGIELLNKEQNEHKTIHFSHFPEIIKMSGKFNNCKRINNYIRFERTMVDTLQIFNLKYLYFILVQYDWNGLSHKRIEDMPGDVNKNKFNQAIYTPLRELCRHFDGYEHVHITDDCPALILPKNTFYYDNDTLIKKMTAQHDSNWTINNNFIIPQEWIDINISLHNIKEYTLEMIENKNNKEGFSHLNKNKNNIIYCIIIIIILFIMYYNIYLIPLAILIILISTSFFIKKEGFDNKVKLSLLAQMKNETMNLKIWIEHYLWQGVEKIYLIDNGSTDEPLKILQPYIDKGILYYISLPEKHKQAEHYRKVINDEDLINKTEWLIICDLDEFFYGFPNKLIYTIDEYKTYDIIYSNWLMFGSDGLVEHPKDIRKSIIWRDNEFAHHKKYIFKPNKVKTDDINIHGIDNISNIITVNDKIRLNHYPIQSLEFFTKVKMTRGSAANVKNDNIRDMEYFNAYNENKNYKDDVLSNLIKNINNK